jgi:hypothetical protein
MKKIIMALVLLMSMAASWAQYNVGETVLPIDNLSWTIEGPSGNSEVGQSSDIFTKISEKKAVFLFMGQLW